MSCLVYVLLCLSLHACNARQLGVVDKGTSIEVLSMGRVTAPNMEIGKAELVHNTEKDEGETVPSFATANSMKEKESNCKNSKGYETKVPPSEEVLQVATNTEGWKRQERSTLGSMPHDDEETIKSKEDDIIEDIVAMDYAQPHRKPPIHNKKP